MNRSCVRIKHIFLWGKVLGLPKSLFGFFFKILFFFTVTALFSFDHMHFKKHTNFKNTQRSKLEGHKTRGLQVQSIS